MQNLDNSPNPETPAEFTGIQLERPATVAAGVPAVLSSMKHVFGAMPVGRGLKTLLVLNQKGGVDCPSCAWPDPDEGRSMVAEYCENGAKAIADEATTRSIGSPFFQRYSVAELASKSDYWLGQQGRLSQPMYLPKGATHYQKIDWNDAFALIGHYLKTLNSPDEAIFYTSGRSSNEAAFLYQLFVRMYGTNNLPDCSNMCHESSGVALNHTLGLGKGSVTLADFEQAEVILILGQNPGTNHPRMLAALEKAKNAGATIVAINPLVEAGLVAFKDPKTLKGTVGSGTQLSDLYLQVKINGDLALMKAVIKILLEKEKAGITGILDYDFIQNHTENYQDFLQDLQNYDIPTLAEDAGLSIEQVKVLAEVLTHKNRIIACWAMGLTQHKNAVATIQEVVNLLLLKGSIGKPGAGTCPVRGHSNVQGDRTVGINEKPTKAFLDRLEQVFGFTPPQHHGYDTVAAIKAMHEGTAKVFFALGGNFMSATPDTQFTAEALQRTQLTVQVSTKLNRSHLIHGQEALILPCLGRTDQDPQASGVQFVTTENSMGVVQTSTGILQPNAQDMLSEVAIVARLAMATLPPQKHNIDWQGLMDNYDKIRELIEKTIAGFEQYNQRVRQDGGFYLPNAPRKGMFQTPTQKAQFTVNTWQEIPLAEGEFLMMSIRSHDQFNTTIYGLNDRYRGIYNERRIVMMNPADMEKAKLQTYDVVNLYNYFGGVERVAKRFLVVPYNIPPRCVATYFPETNVLVPLDSIADGSHTPTSKSVVIQIKKT